MLFRSNGLVGGLPLAVTEAPTITSQAFGTDKQKSMATYTKNNAGAKGVVGPVVYHLDNEPSLWSTTHRDIVPTLPSSSAFFATSAATAAAVKQGDSTGLVAGPGEWGWCAWLFFPSDGCSAVGGGETQTAGKDYAQAYLAAMHAAEVSGGTPLLDVFDEHFYPQRYAVFGNPDTTNAGDATLQAQRLDAVRGLWDPAFDDGSWIGQPTRLIPRMKAWRTAVYGAGNGPKLGVSEYAFGAIDSMNGALAQADALGVQIGRAHV